MRMDKGYTPWNKGKHLSEEIKEKMRKSSIGSVPWNKGLTKETNESLRRMSEVKKGRISYEPTRPAWDKGMKEKSKRLQKPKLALYGDEVWLRQQYLLLNRSRYEIARTCGCNEATIRNWLVHFHLPIRNLVESKKIRPTWCKGLTKKTDTRLIRSIKMKRKICGENNPNWIDGRSFLPYPVEFDRQLKELIRCRDDYQCQKCGCSEIENIKKLCVHHIDYDKENCLPSNLTALCQSCNSLVNSNREFWKQYFSTKLRERGL